MHTQPHTVAQAACHMHTQPHTCALLARWWGHTGKAGLVRHPLAGKLAAAAPCLAKAQLCLAAPPPDRHRSMAWQLCPASGIAGACSVSGRDDPARRCHACCLQSLPHAARGGVAVWWVCGEQLASWARGPGPPAHLSLGGDRAVSCWASPAMGTAGESTSLRVQRALGCVCVRGCVHLWTQAAGQAASRTQHWSRLWRGITAPGPNLGIGCLCCLGCLMVPRCCTPRRPHACNTQRASQAHGHRPSKTTTQPQPAQAGPCVGRHLEGPP